MNNQDFRQYAHQLVDWMADYYEQVEELPVQPQVKPGDILKQLPEAPPYQGEPFEALFKDFNEIIMPGMTHWQHPKFFAYFPANTSYPSILAEMLMSTLGAQCMSWNTSPAATELEQRVMEWLRDALALPKGFSGVIQDTASTGTLCALLSAREHASQNGINQRGFTDQPIYRIYCSTQAHSSIEKAVKIAGFGADNLCKVAVDDEYALCPDALMDAIHADKAKGYLPLCVVSALGTTSSTALDPIGAIAEICQREGVWHHVDAAYAGTALLLPEYQHWIKGIVGIDSFVMNPHKWMMVQFDCSAYFVKDATQLKRTFELLPEYLKTKEDGSVKHYRDWGITLGRRFRALKLWFVIRSYGLEGLQQTIRHHIELAQSMVCKIDDHPDFERLAPTPLNLICFRFNPKGKGAPQHLNELNEALLERLNMTGALFMTHTKLNEGYVIRWVIGQTQVAKHHIEEAWQLVQDTANNLLHER